MRRFSEIALAATALVAPILAGPNCPLAGPTFPKPTNLQKDKTFQSAISNIPKLIQTYIDNSTSSGSNAYSYAVQVFSASDSTPLWEHYWTAPNLPSLNSSGVKVVDKDTVFRLGSVTKIFTIVTFLAQVGDSSWNDPVTKYIPELAAMLALHKPNKKNSVSTPDWDDITIGSLASQASGLIRDYSLLGEVTQELDRNTPISLGFPPLQDDEVPPCGEWPLCTRQQTFAGLAKMPPSFPSYTTPTYSDIAFQLLAYALETMTGNDFWSMVEESIITPLNLTRTFYYAPDSSMGIIPGDVVNTTWLPWMGDGNPTGNMYASASDLSTFGRAILSSSLLPPAVTRRWLRPQMFTSDPTEMVGSPWGVRTIDLGTTYQTVTAFAKAGSIGHYSTLFAIIPAYDIGFSIMSAGSLPVSLNWNLADTIAYYLVPALQDAAKRQAGALYAGRYTSSDRKLNSSITIATDDRPGLSVSTWISNGTDMRPLSVAMGSNMTWDQIQQIQASVRLYPTGLEDKNDDGTSSRAFKAIFEDLRVANVTTTMSTSCSTWIGVTSIVYGSLPLDEFVFNLDANGKVTGIRNLALRATLNKVS